MDVSRRTFFKTTLIGGAGVTVFGFSLAPVYADPRWRNAGWSAFLYYGGDQATARDARRFGPHGGRSDPFSGNIQNRWNQWATFAYEQGY